MRFHVVLCLVLAACLAGAAGCSRKSEPSQAKQESAGEVGSEAEATAPSPAARARGVAGEAGEESEKPEIVLDSVSYEWCLTPQKGLSVTLELTNPHDTFERAKGYVFVTAAYSQRRAATLAVYPENARLKGDLPADYRDGEHFVYRTDFTTRAFIPYHDPEGYFDSMRVLVYSEEGDIAIDQMYPLDVTGEPTGAVKPKPTLVF